jgi:hypothetical protein
MIRSFTFPDSRTAYDASQTNDDIRDGDVLLVPSEGNMGVFTGEVPRMHEIARQHGWTDTP